jgi:hypothetical protein
MFALIPLIAFGFINLVIARLEKTGDWRRVFLLSAVVWGGLVVLNTEILSLGRGLNFRGGLSFWIAVCLGLGVLLRIFPGERRKFFALGSAPVLDRVLLFFAVAIPAVIAVTAGMAAPNNWDSLVYHMSRVAHWIQNETVAHYPTVIKKQLYFQPWAGYAVAQFQILSGSDRLANFVQWFGLIGNMVAVSSIAGLLGAGMRYQIFSALLVVTIPMGILQASTTQTDQVTAFWLACFVYFLLETSRNPRMGNILAMGSGLGLAILTKSTVYFYAFPFLLWFMKSAAGSDWRRQIQCVVTVLGLAVLLNAGHYGRNWLASGSILGESIAFEKTCNLEMTPGLWVSNVVRNLGLHLGTSWPDLNRGLEKAVYALHDILKVNIVDPRTTFRELPFFVRQSLHEDTAGNFVHLVLIVLTVIFLIREWRKLENSPLRAYFCSLLGGAVLFTLFLKWQPWNSRLHLPGFVLWAPLISLMIERWQRKKAAVLVGITVILFYSALPYIFYAKGRRLYARTEPTILNTPRLEQYFAHKPHLLKPYQEAVQAIRAQGCTNVGLSMENNMWEYPVWVLMREGPSQDFRLEHVQIEEGAPLPYPLGDFSPCAIIRWDGNPDNPSLKLHFPKL